MTRFKHREATLSSLFTIHCVPQNVIGSDNNTEPGIIPAQIIDRVEIIKGAASVAWGQGLGGVVNVITKSGNTERALSGAGQASLGERLTSDLTGELGGTLKRFGYYLSAGNLHSKGLITGTRVNFNHLFGKFTYQLPNKGSIKLWGDFRDSKVGLEDIPSKDYRDSGSSRYAAGSIAVNTPLADKLSLDVNGWLGQRRLYTQWGAFTTTDLFRDLTTRENFSGARSRLMWGDSAANLAVGLEYENTVDKVSDLVTPELNYSSRLTHWGTFLSGSYDLGPLTILPGFRYDTYSTYDNASTSSLGATFRLTDSTVLRAYAANGYSLPSITTVGNKKLQKLWTVQSGIESTIVPYLWLKGMYFYNDLSDIEAQDGSLFGATKQGVEVEAKSSPFFGFSVSGGYTYTIARNKATGEELKSDGANNCPPHAFKAALDYSNNKLGLHGKLFGNYVMWDSGQQVSKDRTIIWDLHLNQQLFPGKEFSPELFFSVHNLFNGSQYLSETKPNAPRWIEGGVRFKF